MYIYEYKIYIYICINPGLVCVAFPQPDIYLSGRADLLRRSVVLSLSLLLLLYIHIER